MEQDTLEEQEVDHSCWPTTMILSPQWIYTLTLKKGHGTLVFKGGDQGPKQLKKRFFKRASALSVGVV